ncbi:MAG: hypothetical protein LW870_09135 [Pirellula sp.]|nr:hypothetical protein [Pirellula sp.]
MQSPAATGWLLSFEDLQFASIGVAWVGIFRLFFAIYSSTRFPPPKLDRINLELAGGLILRSSSNGSEAPRKPVFLEGVDAKFGAYYAYARSFGTVAQRLEQGT